MAASAPHKARESRTTTAIRFPDSVHERLRMAADERDFSINFMVVKAVEDFLDRLIPAEELRLTR
jgi:predicted transcriptional regulator